MKGQFITIEGGEGAGKSTVIELILQWAKETKIHMTLTREPGGTAMAEEIRQVMLAPREEQVDPMTELLLVFAARRQHVTQLIEPSVNAGNWVLSDRYLDSSFVYQGTARGLSTGSIQTLANLVVGNVLPDLTLLLDVPVDVGLKRVAGRGKVDRLDAESVHFHEKVREGFLRRASQEPHRFRVIDASKSLEDVLLQVRNVLDEYRGSLSVKTA